ncbi:MAG TPA: 7-cyano-7-deazaguanine synthase [Pirellulales bacterium]|nr:7-cyano-7-deazaguanine synthase [Pirellulales bacterium]
MAAATTGAERSEIGVLASGGLDSCILLSHLLERGYGVRPFYVRSGLVWQDEELRYLKRYLQRVGTERLRELVLFDLPLRDLYDGHWSVSGDGVPDESTADEAVFLPGRNLLLSVKAALWCQLHGIQQLCLATLNSNPFADASDGFFDAYQTALNCGVTTTSLSENRLGEGDSPRFASRTAQKGDSPRGSWKGSKIEILRPFAEMSKREVMQLGRNYPLNDTFSCIAPINSLHCGHCNKCAERKAAFAAAEMPDSTTYAASSVAPHPSPLAPQP